MNTQTEQTNPAEKEDPLLIYAKKQYRMSAITACCSLAVLLIVLITAVVLIPRFVSLYENLKSATENLNVITKQLSESDLKGMVENVGSLVATTQKDLDAAMEKINAIDIDLLNKSIQSLHDVLTPIANFFNVFKH